MSATEENTTTGTVGIAARVAMLAAHLDLVAPELGSVSMVQVRHSDDVTVSVFAGSCPGAVAWCRVLGADGGTARWVPEYAYGTGHVLPAYWELTVRGRLGSLPVTVEISGIDPSTTIPEVWTCSDLTTTSTSTSGSGAGIEGVA